ncbi:hypothetical protein NN4_12500 [Nocardia ninae NBRC 108245]|uniref:Uncharacterized protein n=1 Tax=Nocardia ninae NBRC 108245 TaxID=1210091 RepID=A0A511M823_9NOCA|nr:hypothetical protein NN4_12500 [Nocardia ninae NBRC 108245]
MLWLQCGISLAGRFFGAEGDCVTVLEQAADPLGQPLRDRGVRQLGAGTPRSQLLVKRGTRIRPLLAEVGQEFGSIALFFPPGRPNFPDGLEHMRIQPRGQLGNIRLRQERARQTVYDRANPDSRLTQFFLQEPGDALINRRCGARRSFRREELPLPVEDHLGESQVAHHPGQGARIYLEWMLEYRLVHSAGRL